MHLNRHPSAKYSYPAFLCKRLCFVVIAIVFVDFGCHQVQIVVCMELFYLMWSLNVDAYIDKSYQRLVVCNEMCQLLIFYQLMVLTQYSVTRQSELNSTMKLRFGYSIVGCIFFISLLNLVRMVLKAVKSS